MNAVVGSRSARQARLRWEASARLEGREGRQGVASKADFDRTFGLRIFNDRRGIQHSGKRYLTIYLAAVSEILETLGTMGDAQRGYFGKNCLINFLAASSQPSKAASAPTLVATITAQFRSGASQTTT